eukprot:CAMPEP_0169062590 /NCGR_PEP_ID=MMETSP1015-20121227/774_1 /TAXON_ID=342587 /ORGANISM="Karlodinium micrum, Strain CCMP2283" /LENGTH=122 /DNA_ID=CAMNT_0009120753 /DNA_START=130 /DNA_END=498 /DNA_ORIENTATION=+
MILNNKDYTEGRCSAPAQNSMFKAAGVPLQPRKRVCSAAHTETLFRGHRPPKERSLPRAYSMPKLMKTWNEAAGAKPISTFGDRRPGVESLSGTKGPSAFSEQAAKRAFSAVRAMQAMSSQR